VAERIWDEVISDRDREVYAEAGYGKQGGFVGERPALLVIDVTYDFCGDVDEPILDSIKKFRNSCGETAWQALPKLQELIGAAREKGVPVIYTHASPRIDLIRSGGWARKNSRAMTPTAISEQIGNDFPDLVAPEADDIVIQKGKPSAFFATPLVSYLVAMNIDSLIITGTTTSGCVRASVIDGFSYNYPLSVVEECVFDRGETTHKINLFDMHSKYADVVTLAETLEYLKGLAARSTEIEKVAVPVEA
jgi:nicotinamidase-related amidase